MERMKVIGQTAREILAPVMVEFVKWVLREAERLGVERLYFLARDGWPMYQTARILSKGRHPYMECRYLECSRYSLRLPAFSLMGKSCLDQIFLGGIDMTLEKILKRAGLTPWEIQKAAEERGLSDRILQPLSYREIQELKSVFSRSPLFLQMVEDHSRKALPKALGYLRQEGLLDPVKWAVVDSGWTGSMQQTLGLLLSSMGWKGTPLGFYFGMYRQPPGTHPCQYREYYFSVWGNIRRKVYFSNSLFECIFRSPAGMTLGYQKKPDGRFAPVYRPGSCPNEKELDLVLEEVTRQALREAERLDRSIRAWRILPPRSWEKTLGRFMGNPTPRQAEAFGTWRFTDDVLENDHQVAAPLLSGRELTQNHLLPKLLRMTGLIRKQVRESAWIEGSAVRRGKWVRWHLFWIRLYKYVLYGSGKLRKNTSYRRGHGHPVRLDESGKERQRP